jgi:hypothetical protein
MQATAFLPHWQQLSSERRRHLMLALLGTAVSWSLAGLLATHRAGPSDAPQASRSQDVHSADAGQSIRQAQPANAAPAQP